MKKLISLLVVLAMLMAIAPAVFAEDYPVGSIYNMDILELGQNTCSVEANPDGAMEKDYFYAWGTEVAGTFTIDFADDSEGTPFCQIYVNNMPLDEFIGEKGGSMSVELEANSMLWIQVGEYNYEAATFTFTATFVATDAEGGMAGSGTEEDPWIIEALPVTLEGSFTEAEATNEDFAGHYYQFTVTEAGTVSWSQWKNCGLFVTVNGAWADADARDVVPGDVVVINTFPFYAADYTATIEFEANAGGEGGEGGEEGGEVVEGIHLGDNLFEIPEASNDGDVFVATEDGTLVIVVTGMWIYDAELGDYVEVAPGNHIGRMGNYLLVIDGVEQTGNVASVEVVAGQEVEIYIATTFGAAAKATVNLSMEEEEQPGGENDTPASGTVDVTADSPIVYELVLDADATVTITLSSTAGWEVHIGNADASVDSRYWSDSDASPVIEALAAGVYTITIYGYDEASWDYIDATITYDISVGAGEGGEEPGCAHENAYLDYEYYEDDSGFDVILICPDCGEVLERYAPGEHEMNPILIDFVWNDEFTVATATVTVPAGKTLWFGQYRIGGLLLTINGEEYGIIADMGPYSAAVFFITNDGAEEATYELALSYPLGSEGNPDDLVINEDTILDLPENNNGYIYEWIATENGTLTITITGENWWYFVNNFGDPEDWSDDVQSDWQYAVYDGVNTITLNVKAGDHLQLTIGTQDMDWNTPAQTLTISVTFVAEGGEEPGCAHENAYLDYEYYEDDSGFDVILICPDCGEIVERFAAGEHEMNPILIDFVWNDEFTVATATVTVPAGKTLWFGQYRIGGLLLTINGEEYGIIADMGPYSAAVFFITNDGAEEATYELALSYPLGSEGNPDDLVVNEDTILDLPENNNGYIYEWIATENGTLTITIAGENWWYFVNNFGDPEDWSDDVQSDWQYAVYDGVNTITLNVKAGDHLQLTIGTQDMDWNTPAQILTISVTFVAEGGEEGPCAHENLVHFDAIEPGCHYNGNIEYWVCYDCEGVWADEALTQVTNILSVVLPAAGGEVVHFEAIAPGCHMDGQIEHWVCYECEQVWADEALTQVTNKLSTVLPAIGGEVVHVEAKAPSCTEDGNIEHWYCEECQQVWQDEALTQLTNHMNVKLGATGHTFVDGECHCGAKDENPPTGDAIAIFCALVAVSSMGLAVLPKKKEN